MSDVTPILHMLAPREHNSPYDVNMAADAGYETIVPYGDNRRGRRTRTRCDLFRTASGQSLHRRLHWWQGRYRRPRHDGRGEEGDGPVPPFRVSVFADPAGSFTTAAAMVACVERVLKFKLGRSLTGMRVAVFGATGVVGFASSVISALEGASVQLVAHRGVERVIKAGGVSKERFGVDLDPVNGETDEQKRAIIANEDVILVAATAGTRVISAEQLKLAHRLLVIADVNAVPPLGVEGMDPFMDGAPLAGCDALGVGPLTIGNIKYKTESGLFKQMIASDEPLALDFRHAFTLARELTA